VLCGTALICGGVVNQAGRIRASWYNRLVECLSLPPLRVLPSGSEIAIKPKYHTIPKFPSSYGNTNKEKFGCQEPVFQQRTSRTITIPYYTIQIDHSENLVLKVNENWVLKVVLRKH